MGITVNSQGKVRPRFLQIQVYNNEVYIFFGDYSAGIDGKATFMKYGI